MRRFLLIKALVALFITGLAIEASAASIVLVNETSVKSDLVRLRDVAKISDIESIERFEELCSTVICAAPPPAEAHVLGANMIASALISSGVDVSGLTLAGPTQVIVRREYDVISVEELKRSFLEHVIVRKGWPENSFLVKAPKNLEDMPAPVGENELRIETSLDEDFVGSVLARVQVITDGKPYRIFSRRFNIERYVEALGAVRKIQRGQAVNASDVKIQKVEQSRLKDNSLTDPGQAIGLLAVNTIHPGRILNADMLREAPVVQKGEYASIMWEGEGFHIMARGLVLEDGADNEIIRVRLPTRKIVKARVLDSKTLQVLRNGE